MFALNKSTNLYHVFPSGSDLLCRTEHTCVHAQCLFVCMRLWDGVACRGVDSHSKDESAACIYPWPGQRHREDLCHFENEVFINYKQPLFFCSSSLLYVFTPWPCEQKSVSVENYYTVSGLHADHVSVLLHGWKLKKTSLIQRSIDVTFLLFTLPFCLTKHKFLFQLDVRH